MTKTIEIAKTETAFFIPADYLRAVYHSVSTEETRYYLNGVYIESDETRRIRMVSTDGHTLLKCELPDDAFMGEQVATQADSHYAGFILQTDVTEKAFKAKSRGELWIYGDSQSGILQFVDMMPGETELPRLGVCEFTRVDGTFPDWRRVMPAPVSEYGAVSVNPDYIARLTKGAKILSHVKTPAIRIQSGGNGEPMSVEWQGVEQMQGVIMPMRWG